MIEVSLFRSAKWIYSLELALRYEAIFAAYTEWKYRIQRGWCCSRIPIYLHYTERTIYPFPCDSCPSSVFSTLRCQPCLALSPQTYAEPASKRWSLSGCTQGTPHSRLKLQQVFLSVSVLKAVSTSAGGPRFVSRRQHLRRRSWPPCSSTEMTHLRRQLSCGFWASAPSSSLHLSNDSCCSATSCDFWTWSLGCCWILRLNLILILPAVIPSSDARQSYHYLKTVCESSSSQSFLAL